MHANTIVIPSYSLTPSKLVLYNKVLRATNGYSFKSLAKSQSEASNLVRSFHGFNLSKNAINNLKSKINWLYFLAKKKNITTYAGKSLFAHKVTFLTLTLPSAQKHNTKFINENVLNQFLTEIRSRLKMIHYVWRLEFQKNGNVHYHLVTDVYIDYFFAQRVWNRILNKFGYVDAYSDKFKNMTFSDYFNSFSKSAQKNHQKIQKSYNKGVSENWQNPNSVDVKNVTSGKNIAGYISKYFSKKSKTAVNHNDLDDETNSKNMRLWFCSRSLSKLDKIKGTEDNAPFNIYDAVMKSDVSVKIKFEYVTVIYFDLKKILFSASSKLRKILVKYVNAVFSDFDNSLILTN